MNNSRGISVFEVLGCLVVVLIVAAILAPSFLPQHGRIAYSSLCQSNMKQIGVALKVYISNWDDKFPTNRIWTDNGTIGHVRPHVKLSKLGELDKDENQIIFQHGANWAEALYRYVECPIKQSDPSAWQCTKAAKDTYPEHSHTAYISYVFNRNLVELNEKYINEAAHLMMVREMDRLVDSDLRPINKSTKNPNEPPISPFLTKGDCEIGETNPGLHAADSNILFADGHVKQFASKFFPEKLTKEKNWDPKTKQWYNFVFKKSTADQKRVNKSIAITP